MNAQPAQVFTGAARQDMTPCMVAFEKWWAENAYSFPLNVQDAWRIFRNGWWKCEEQQ